MKSGRIVIGIIAGAVVGSIVGLLFAPHKGSKTRKKIISTGGDVSKSLTNQIEKMSNALQNKYDGAIQEVDDIIENGKNKYNESMLEVNEFINKGKSKISDHKSENV